MVDELDSSRKRPGAVDWQRSDTDTAQITDVPTLISHLYEQAPAAVRVRLLEQLLRPVGPLAMVAIAAGAFGRFVRRLGPDAAPIAHADAERISSSDVLHLARYVEQSSPELLHQIGWLIANRLPARNRIETLRRH